MGDAARQLESYLGEGHVLFVDDQPLVVKVTSIILEKLGYEVTSCSSATEALEQLKKYPDKFDIVLTDRQMPVMCGFELIQGIKALRKDLPVVLISGSSRGVQPEEIKKRGFASYIEKPFTIEELGLLLKQVLNARQ